MGGAAEASMGAAGRVQGKVSKKVTEEGEKRLFDDIPGPPPDLTSEIIRAAQRAEADRLRVGRTRASTFMAANRNILGG